jgi:hypothetical protein
LLTWRPKIHLVPPLTLCPNQSPEPCRSQLCAYD